MDASTLRVTHDAAHQRFTVELDGNTAELAYQQQDAVLTITHTRVPDAIGGRGVAAALVEAASGFAGEAGLKVIPACSYADAYMRRHPQFQALLA